MLFSRFRLAARCALALLPFGSLAAESLPPHLERRGQAVQLISDGAPFLILGGELTNTASSDLEVLRPIWPRLVAMNLNTALVGVSWALVEPAEGHFDFSLIDGALQGAREHHLHLILIWFGSWKNGISSFAPTWVKTDQQRFPRVRVSNGHSLEVLSPLNEANRDADTRAYAAFMEHLKAVDGRQHTVLMIQLENEVGVLGDSRDRSADAERAFGGPVAPELTHYLSTHRTHLTPALREAWETSGARETGSWTQVFGNSAATDERFMAWAYARFMDHLAEAGKREYPIPVFTNTWIVQPADHGPGDYPSGGPEPQVLDLWRAGAPHIDLNAPDVYLPNFTEWADRFHRSDNPLFIPESRGDAAGAANAFYAIGRHAGLGYSPFGIDTGTRLLALRPAGHQAAPIKLGDLPLPRSYALLRELAPLILAGQAQGTITASSLTAAHPIEQLPLGDYVVKFNLLRNFRNPDATPPFGYGLAIALGPNEYLVAGSDIQVTFSPRTPGPPIAGLARAEAGHAEGTRWVAGRVLNGDDLLLDYHLAAAAADGQSGSGLKFSADEGPTAQRVLLYRYGP